MRSSAELSGELAEAARAWREICTVRQAEPGSGEAYAAAESRLAAVHDMRGERDLALAARAAAAEGYAEAGKHAEAAVERLAMANYLRFARPAQRGDRAGAGGREGRRAGGAAGSAGSRARAQGSGAGQTGRVREGTEDRAHRPRARPRARPHARRGRALPAAERRALRLGRLPPRPGDARQRPGALPHHG